MYFKKTIHLFTGGCVLALSCEYVSILKILFLHKTFAHVSNF